MKNLIVAIGGTGGTALRSLKYRLGLFNTLGSTSEEVQEIYIDTLSKQKLEAGESKEGAHAKDKSYLTLGSHEIDDYVEYKGKGITGLADRLLIEPENRMIEAKDAHERYTYRWFHAPYYRGIGQAAILEKVEEGAGQYRQFGRLVIDRNYEHVATALMKKIKQMSGNFRVFMVFSVAGGTGAGAAFDTAMILRSLAAKERKIPSIYAFIVMGKAFSLKDTSPTYAALRELLRLGSRDGNAVYSVDYKANSDNRTVLSRELFDAKFIVDFHEGVSELKDDNLRYLGLYPSLADLIELMVQEGASRYLYEAAANWPSNVQAAKSLKANQVVEGGIADDKYDYKMVKKGLRDDSQHSDWFVTYKTQRIFFPKDLYLDISRNQLVEQFLKELCPWRGDYTLKENLSLKTGKEVTGEVLEKEKNENCYDILKSWNRNLMGSVASDNFKSYVPFHDRDLSNRFDKYGPDEIVESLFIKETEKSGISEIKNENIEEELAGSVVKDAEDVRNFLAVLKTKRGDAQTKIEDALKLQDATNKNVIRLRMARHAVNMLNTKNMQGSVGIVTQKGTLAFAREVFRYLVLHYLNPINRRLGTRGENIRTRVEELDNQCSDKETALENAGDMKKGDLRTTQKELLGLEQERLEQFRGEKANAKLIDYVEFATTEANQWLDWLKGWGNRLVSDTQNCLRLRAEKAVAEDERRLRELAMSSGVSVGLPQHEFPPTTEGTRQTRSFGTVKTDMGGFQQYVHEQLKPDELVTEWTASFDWAVKADIGQIENDVPTNHLIKPIEPVISLAGTVVAEGEQQEEGHGPVLLTNESGLYEQLEKLVKKAAEPLAGINLFEYLTKWVPDNKDMTLENVANKIGETFRASVHYLECDVSPGLWHSYLAYNQVGAGDFVHSVGLESIGPHEHEPSEIPNYGDGNSLAFVHFAVGVTIEDAPSLRQPQEAYIHRIVRGRSTVGSGAHDIGETLSNHIYPEEQAMLRFEIEKLKVADGSTFSGADLVPVEMSPLFADLERLDLFVQLYAARLIWWERDGNSNFFWYRKDPDVGTPAEPKDRFKLSGGQSLMDAARKFVAREQNMDTGSLFKYLTSEYGAGKHEMMDNLRNCVDVYLKQDNETIRKVKRPYADPKAQRAAMRIEILRRSIRTIEGYAGQDLERHFDVNYGTVSKRNTVLKDRLQTLMLHFFREALERAKKELKEALVDDPFNFDGPASEDDLEESGIGDQEHREGE